MSEVQPDTWGPIVGNLRLLPVEWCKKIGKSRYRFSRPCSYFIKEVEIR